MLIVFRPDKNELFFLSVILLHPSMSAAGYVLTFFFSSDFSQLALFVKVKGYVRSQIRARVPVAQTKCFSSAESRVRTKHGNVNTPSGRTIRKKTTNQAFPSWTPRKIWQECRHTLSAGVWECGMCERVQARARAGPLKRVFMCVTRICQLSVCFRFHLV